MCNAIVPYAHHDSLEGDDCKVLRGLIHICAWCKKVRDDLGFWSQIETYIREHSEADFTHGICPECMAGELSGEKDDRPSPPGARSRRPRGRSRPGH